MNPQDQQQDQNPKAPAKGADNQQNPKKADRTPLAEITKTLKESNNVLITISRDPSIDQLAAAIGLTLALNGQDKHATAVYSGATPPIIEFLEPEKTLEKNTDSLRDFIISLDKSKADKLRYKVEDSVVKIFITPYRTSISEEDLEFSQGDFNVDAIVALGVQTKADLDSAIVAHGRILHDASIIAISNQDQSEIGTVQWVDQSASSLSEMVVDIVSALDKKLIDSATATALLTGIIYETDRFRNEKASPHTMSVSGVLMEAGASTQLVAEKLEEHQEPESIEIPAVEEEPEQEQPPKDPGLIEIDHDEEPEDDPDQIHIDDSGKLRQISEILDEVREDNKALEEVTSADNILPEEAVIEEQPKTTSTSMVYEPPKFGGQLTANSDKVDQQYLSAPDPLTSDTPGGATLTHHNDTQPTVDNQTLTDLEKSIGSPHADPTQLNAETHTHGKTISPVTDSVINHTPVVDVNYAQDAVQRAVAGSTDYRPEPIQALGAQPVGLDMGHPEPNIIRPDNPQGPPPPPVPPPMVPLG